MSECEQYWVVRYCCLGLSTLMIVLTLLLILIEKLYRFLACKLIMLMNLCFLVVMINALLYTDRFVEGSKCYYEENLTHRILTNPQFGECRAEAYFIHSFWLAGFNISILLNFFIHKVLNGEAEFIARWYKKLLALCVMIPLLIMAAPLIYSPGYGPTGFPIMVKGINDQYSLKFAYLFCGWYEDNPEPKEFQLKNFLIKFANNSFPVLLLCALSIWVGVRIRLRKRLLEREEVQFTRKEKNILRTRWIPLMCIFVWVFNTLLRLPFNHNSLPVWLQWAILALNTSFDLLPTAECLFFIVYIMVSIPLKHLKFMSLADDRSLSLLSSGKYVEEPEV